MPNVQAWRVEYMGHVYHVIAYSESVARLRAEEMYKAGY